MSFSAEVYVLRHCTPSVGSEPNRARPLSEAGLHQAQALVPILSHLEISVVYTSPFRRALDTVSPFCETVGLAEIEMEDLSESAHEEELPEVRTRLIDAIGSIAETHDSTRVLACTHGGCLWGVISYFDSNFGYDDYRGLKCPDMRRIVYEGGVPSLDRHFQFELCIP